MTRLIVRFAGLVVLSSAVGCGGAGAGGKPGTVTVTGKVTLPGGKPLPGGRIDFRSAADPNKLGSGLIKGDGSYEATDVPLGECKVSVDNASLRPATKTSAAAAEAMPGTHDQGQKYVPINARYAKPETSGLTTTVAAKGTTYDVEVK